MSKNSKINYIINIKANNIKSEINTIYEPNYGFPQENVGGISISIYDLNIKEKIHAFNIIGSTKISKSHHYKNKNSKLILASATNELIEKSLNKAIKRLNKYKFK